MSITRGSKPYALHELLLAPTLLALICTTLPARAELEEVVVTARKRDENIQNIPVAVTAVSAQKLDDYGLRDIESIAANVPQLNVVRGSSGSGATLSLRGVGSSFTSIGIEQSVAVVLDDVYYGQGRIINEGFFDMQQAEILRGPQALFFGKNATAGVLSFRSADPGHEFEALGRVGREFKSKTSTYEGIVSGPVNDTLGLRLAVRYSDMSGGYMQNVAPATTLSTLNVNTFASAAHFSPAPERHVPGEEDLAVRLTGKWTPSNEFSLTVKGSATRYRVKNATWNSELLNCPLGHSQVNPTETCNGDRVIQQNDVPPDIAATNSLLNRHGGQLYQDYDASALSVKAAYTADKVDITSVTGLHQFVNYFLGDYDFSGGANGGTWGSEQSKYKAFTEEIRAQTKLDGPLNVMAGVYFDNSRLDFDQRIIFPGALENPAAADPSMRYLTLTKRSYTDGATIAGFGQVQWKFAPEFELDVGARYTHETKESQFLQPYVITLYQAVFRQNHPISANQKFHNFSPETTLTWRPSESWTSFISYKEGYKSGGFSGSALDSAVGNTTVNDLAFQPEKAKGWEAGIRASLADHTVRLALTAYDYQYSDLQVDFFDATKIQYITKNAASADVKGIEFEGEWAPPAVSGLVLRTSLAYNESNYKNFRDAPCWGGQTPAEGCTIIAGRPTQDLSGHVTALAPKWAGSFEANYDHNLTDGLIFGAGLNLRYSDKYFSDQFGNPRGIQKAYSTIDGMLRLKTTDSHWEVALIGKNLTNKYVVYNTGDAPSSGAGTGTAAAVRSDRIGTPNPPRTYALQLTYRY